MGFVFEADVGDDDRDEGNMELVVVGEKERFELLEELVVGGKGLAQVRRRALLVAIYR